MKTIENIAENTKVSFFKTNYGASEYFLTITSKGGISFQDSLDAIAKKYEQALDTYQLDRTTVQFTRVYLSDISNEQPLVINSHLYNLINNGAVSFIQQPPLDSGFISILSYHITDSQSIISRKQFFDPCNPLRQRLLITSKQYSLFWTANYCAQPGECSEAQTERLFADFCSDLHEQGFTLKNDVMRTWIYIRDIDNNYNGMVNARRELFHKIGLEASSRYIASTGIEGCSFNPATLVTMDALAIGNLKEEQVIRMTAPQHLSDTILYGVTFERGLKIRFGDRSHFYISGTASIDSNGHILYPGDVKKQTIRTLENIRALLEPHSATIKDMKYLIVYLRNPKHLNVIKDTLTSQLPPDIPMLFVQGPVCRPGWLVEIEGVGVVSDNNEFEPFI